MTLARFLVSFLMVFLCAQTSRAESSASTATIQKLRETIQSSKTVADFVETLPGDTVHLQRFLRAYFPEIYRKGFETANFDLNQKWLQVGKLRFDFSQIEKEKIGFAGKTFSFTQNFFEFYVQVYKGMPKESRSALTHFLLIDAYAQNRDAFPELKSDRVRDLEQLDPNLDEFSYLPLMGLSFFKYRPIKNVGKLAARTVIPAILMYWGLNYAHAYYAPECSTQVKEIRDVLTQSKIGLSELQCGNTIASRAKIAFWTPDHQSLPFVADWTTSELWVNRDEVYHFNKKKLTSVEIEKPGKQISITKGSPEFLEYAKNLEPYRKVLQIIGKYNSCFKCEAEMKAALVTTKPVSEPAPAPEAHAQPGAVQ